MAIIGDATTRSITYDHHFNNFSGVIYNSNIFLVQGHRSHFEHQWDNPMYIESVQICIMMTSEDRHSCVLNEMITIRALMESVRN